MTQRRDRCLRVRVPRDALRPNPGLPDADAASRIRAGQGALPAVLERRETLASLVVETFGLSEPAEVAGVLLERMREWLPMDGWAVVIGDHQGQLSEVGSFGGSDEIWCSGLTVATLVVQSADLLLSADLSRDPRVDGAVPATVVAFPLLSRGRAIGAVVGVDAPSAAAPVFEPRAQAALLEALGTVALALDQACRLQRAEAMSVTDDLTGLYNSRFLREALHREAKRAMRYGRPVTVLFIDLDGFKAVNDTHGHLAGSRTLVEAADVIRASARESDIVARYGGDEFVVVLPDTGSEGGLVVARRIRDLLAQHTFLASEGINWLLTASLGVATLPDMARSSEELLDVADRAMYHVKQTGKNNICLAPRS
jgi:diguanylate cyclase (GGDEF)-like protein